jgi:3-hydroxymyristoyl/3-hydroxydecanoyl-(acyl carrier protein) dehydratase
MTRANEEHRGFGPNIVERILPHRRPFLFVDRVKRFRIGDERSIEAALEISINDPVFDGHFPNWSLWPGVYVVEGLGQSAQLLATLDMIRQAGAERDDETLGFRTLDALDALYSLRPSATPSDEGIALLEEIASSPVVGLATRIDIRFLEPVFPGSRLDYRVDWTLEQNGVMGFNVEASVAGRPVARGELGASINTRIPLR